MIDCKRYNIHCIRKAYLTLGFFFISCLFLNAQNLNLLDSLEFIYSSSDYEMQQELKILKELAVSHTSTDKKLMYSELLIQKSFNSDSSDYLFSGYLEKGNALRLKSDLSHALESYFECARIAEETENNNQLGKVYIAIADVYSIMGNHQNAVKYHQNAIAILRHENDSISIASALLNAGDELINVNNLDSALKYTTEAEVIFNQLGSKIGQAYSLGNLGMIYAKLGLDLKAEYHMNKAILLLQDLQEYYPIAVYLTYISDIYSEKGEEKLAFNYAMLSLELAQKHGMKKQVSDAYLTLSKISELAGKTEEAFGYFKNHIAYKDSVNNITLVQQMGDLRTDYEVSKKQIEVDLLNQQKKTQQIIVIAVIIALILIGLLAFGLYRRYLFIQKTKLIIEKEKNRSDELLLNILPRETANELKLSGKVKAKKFESVTVLFLDFKSFTQYAEKLSPEVLVEQVDYYFSGFDQIMERFGLEKIKTIGDAYMCAGGLPFPSPDHATKMVLAAFEMAQFVRDAKKMNSVSQFEVRIGIHTGPVVAGVVGTKKFAYDIWGDTVNIAARMESSSEPGKINISESTYQLIKDEFDCEFRGEIEAKNRGMMKMYYATARKASTAPDKQIAHRQ